MAAVGAGTTLRPFPEGQLPSTSTLSSDDIFAQQLASEILLERGRAPLNMGKIGFAIIFAAIAAYAVDHRWNDGRYTRSTVAVLRGVQHAIGW